VIGLERGLETPKRHLASQGGFSGGKRPFGFDKMVDGDMVRLVPNAAEMAVIKQMQDMRAARASLREIGAVTGHLPMSVKRILERMAKG
jgi:putative DNA-invertase from lambdoid prophage Rac